MFQQIIGSRGIGKTKALIELASKNNGIIICQNATHMREKAKAYGYDNVKIISYRDVIDNINPHPVSYAPELVIKYYDGIDCPCYIDNLDGFANFVLNNKLTGYSLSME